MPHNVQLEGELALEAADRFAQATQGLLGFEIEPGAITLAEIERRAENFDPFTAGPGSEVAAISTNAWISLGRAGLALHFEREPGQIVECAVLERREPGKRPAWVVIWGGEERARFGRVGEAIEAVDYEIGALGAAPASSARSEAPWRLRPDQEQREQSAGRAWAERSLRRWARRP